MTGEELRRELRRIAEAPVKDLPRPELTLAREASRASGRLASASRRGERFVVDWRKRRGKGKSA